MSELTLIIGNKNYSSWSLRPWIFLKQMGIPFREKRVPLFTDTTRAELEAYGSDYKVPILKDGDLIVWDSLAILEHLSEKHLNGNGWPGNADARAIARSVSSEMHSSFSNVRGEMPMNCRRQFKDFQPSPAAKREVERIKSLWRQCRTQYGSNGEWLFGDYSIADAMFAPIALRFHSYDIPLDGIERAYLQSELNQPGIIEWIEAGKEETEIIKIDEIEV